ncbi:hypothetical protein [Bradyrhizobium sp.]|uniref:hypothetical protein n=1 Tax=Bradyrhizobium sp. TaxID=376 RepID=UPI004037F7EC
MPKSKTKTEPLPEAITTSVFPAKPDDGGRLGRPARRREDLHHLLGLGNFTDDIRHLPVSSNSWDLVVALSRHAEQLTRLLT